MVGLLKFKNQLKLKIIMENQVSTKGIMVNNGIILGVLIVLINVGIYALGQTFDPNPVFTVLQYLVPLAVIYMGIKKFRELNDNSLKLGEAIKIGLGISLIGGIILAVYTFVLVNYIEPEYFTKMFEAVENKMLETNPNMSEEQIEMSLSMLKKMSGAWITIGTVIMTSLFGGLLYSLISGLILKRNKE